jgi:hypothetical protein
LFVQAANAQQQRAVGKSQALSHRLGSRCVPSRFRDRDTIVDAGDSLRGEPGGYELGDKIPVESHDRVGLSNRAQQMPDGGRISAAPDRPKALCRQRGEVSEGTRTHGADDHAETALAPEPTREVGTQVNPHDMHQVNPVPPSGEEGEQSKKESQPEEHAPPTRPDGPVDFDAVSHFVRWMAGEMLGHHGHLFA